MTEELTDVCRSHWSLLDAAFLLPHILIVTTSGDLVNDGYVGRSIYTQMRQCQELEAWFMYAEAIVPWKKGLILKLRKQNLICARRLLKSRVWSGKVKKRRLWFSLRSLVLSNRGSPQSVNFITVNERMRDIFERSVLETIKKRTISVSRDLERSIFTASSKSERNSEVFRFSVTRLWAVGKWRKKFTLNLSSTRS